MSLVLGVLLVMKTLEDEWHILIKANKFTIFEIWRDDLVLPYIFVHGILKTESTSLSRGKMWSVNVEQEATGSDNSPTTQF